MAKRARSMDLYERFLEAVEQRCSGAPEEEADAIALAKGFLAQHGDKVKAAWQRFGANGKLLPGDTLPASAFNDFYKWTMMPVIRSLEKKTGRIQCTFSANIRDKELNAALLDSAKQDPPGELFQELTNGLKELSQRHFDVALFQRACDDTGLSWDAETFREVCGSAEAPRTMVQELDLNPKGTRRLPTKPSEVLVQAFMGVDVKSGQERLFVEATGPWHRVTWLETSMMQVIYESFFRRRMRERYGEEDEHWYAKWLADAFLRGARSVLAAGQSQMRGIIMTGRRTGGLALMLLQGMFIHSNLKDAAGKSLSLGTSSVTAHYWLKDAGVTGELLPPVGGTHAHELSMVSSAVFAELDNKAGVPLSQIISHMLYFLHSRPQGDVRDASRKVLMPILPDTLGSKAFFRTAQHLKIPFGAHKGEPILSVVGAARQDSGSLEAFASLARSFGFGGSLMASEVEVPSNLMDASALGYNTFGAGGFFGDSEKAWSKDGSNISMAIKVLVVHVDGQRTAVDPVKTGDPTAGGEGKFEADGLMSSERLEALKARTKLMQEAEAKLSVEEMQSLFETAFA